MVNFIKKLFSKRNVEFENERKVTEVVFMLAEHYKLPMEIELYNKMRQTIYDYYFHYSAIMSPTRDKTSPVYVPEIKIENEDIEKIFDRMRTFYYPTYCDRRNNV